eukprot:921835-Prymnesium_polylepis.1
MVRVACALSVCVRGGAVWTVVRRAVGRSGMDTVELSSRMPRSSSMRSLSLRRAQPRARSSFLSS